MTRPTAPEPGPGRRISAVVPIIYLIMGYAWILCGDLLTLRIAPDYHSFWHISLYKGISFVSLSALVIWLITRLLEERLVRSSSQFQLIIEASSDGILVLTAEGTILTASRAAADILGIPVRDLIGQRLALLLPTDAEHSPDFSPATSRTLRLQRPDGTTLWILVTFSPLAGNGSQAGALVATLTDITQTRQAQEQLRRTQAAVDNAGVGIVIADEQGVPIYINRAGVELLGYSAEQLASVGGFAHCFVNDEQYQTCAGANMAGMGWEGEARLRAANGHQFQGRLRADVVHAEDGQVSGYVGLVQDVTDLTEAIGALQESEARYRRLFEDAVLGIFQSTEDGHVIEVNPAFARMFGYDSPQEVRETIKDVAADLYMRPEHRPQSLQELQGGAPQVQTEVEYRRKDGTSFTGSLHVWAARDETGAIRHLEGFIEDISERKCMEHELARSRETAWAILNSTPDVATLLDLDFCIVAANEAAANNLGIPVDELLGQPVLDLMGDETAAQAHLQRLREVVQTGLVVQFEDARAGRIFLNTISPVLDGDSCVTSIAVFAHDITDLRLAQDSQRLAAVGQLAAGIAHDFNNLLSSMMMHAELALMLPDPQNLAELPNLVLRAGRRGADICHNLMAFAGPAEPQRTIANVEPCLDAALEIASPQLEAAGVVVARDYAPHSTQLRLDTGQFGQVFLNLIINASHAMPNGGTLTLRTRYYQETGEALVEVQDTGCGISSEHLSRVFEPFFTTKGRLGQSNTPGTGLGLFVTRGIVTAHGGTISVVSQPGVGSTFSLRLPLGAAMPDDLETAPASSPASLPGSTRLLLVDDDEAFGSLASRVLQSRGIEITLAHTTREGLELLEGERFALVVADINMPGGGASAIISAAALLPHPPPVLVLSGALSPTDRAQMLQAGAWNCAEKPMQLAELGEMLEKAVRDALGAGLETRQGASAPCEPPWVLVADDEPHVRRAAAQALAASGYRVREAADAPTAVAALHRHDFALVVSDLLMPGGGGREVLARVAALPHPPPVIIITGRLEGFVKEELLGAGAAVCLSKPFRLLDLVMAADSLTSRQ